MLQSQEIELLCFLEFRYLNEQKTFICCVFLKKDLIEKKMKNKTTKHKGAIQRNYA